MTEQEAIKMNGWTFEETVKTAENLMESEKNMFKWDVLRHLRDFAENFCEEIQQYRAIGTPEEVMQMKRQNIALRNRCKILSGGQLCIFCPIKCEERVEEFRNVKGSVVDEQVSASKGHTGNRRNT